MSYKGNIQLLFKKLYNLQYATTYLFSVHQLTHFVILRTKVLRLPKMSNNYQKLSNLWDILYFISKSTEIQYKIFHKLLIFQKFNLNIFWCEVIRGIVLCKKNHTNLFKK